MRFRQILASIIFPILLHVDSLAQASRTFEISGYPELQELSTHDETPRAAAPFVSRIRLATGVTLEFEEAGDLNGPAVIFLHGFTDSRHSFDYLVPHLASGIHSFVITQRGHGASDKPAQGYAPLDFAEDVKAFMDEQHIQHAVIVGHSMGSTVAQTFALKYPLRVSGLVLMATVPHLKSNAALHEFGAQVALLKDPVDHAFASEFQKSTIHAPIPDSYLDTVINETMKVPSFVWKSVLKGLMTIDYSRDWSRIKAPALVIYGDKDVFSTLQDQEQLKASIPHANLLVYQGVGHAVHWENPVGAARDISAFLKSLNL